VLLAAMVFFIRLDCPLLEPEEARYAEIPRQMLAEGKFAVPVLHGTSYLQKPPLLYWLVMGLFALFGPHDWVARLVPGAAGVLTVLLVICWGRRVLGRRAALLGGLILCLSPRFVYLERMLGMDSLLCLWVTAALLAAQAAGGGKEFRWHWWLLSAVTAGLGLLSKGPVALAIVVTPLLVFQFLMRQRVSWWAWMSYGGVVALVAGPWFLALILTEPQAAADFFWLHNVVRFVAAFDHVRPWWFYLPGLVEDLFPWTLAPVLVLAIWCARAVRGSRGEGRGVEVSTHRSAPVFLVVVTGWCLLFFSCSGCKRPAYMLPGLPPLALLLGWCLDRMLPRSLPRPAQLAAFGVGAVSSLVMLCWQWQWLPRHHHNHALREQVEHGRAALESEAAVFCYPHRWDSVSFYLGRRDAQVIERGRLGKTLASLHTLPETLVFVKREGFLDELRKALPADLELLECGPPGGPAVACRIRVPNEARRSRRVKAAGVPGMATADPPGAPPGSRQRSVLAHSQDEILATARMETTDRGQERPKASLVDADTEDQGSAQEPARPPQ
jgi:4-amino-4-deoxy-L-arabinose transferase-like glycosyltransferase